MFGKNFLSKIFDLWITWLENEKAKLSSFSSRMVLKLPSLIWLQIALAKAWRLMQNLTSYDIKSKTEQAMTT